MRRTYTAVVKRDGKWWIGWIEEVSGVNGQGKTRRALISSLRSALREALEMNRADALSSAQDAYEEVRIEV
jgi:predicted RNase H-like HicB family nuclease